MTQSLSLGRRVASTLSALALATGLAACSSDSASSSDSAGGDSYSIGINQLVQHPSLDAAAEGFQAAFEDAGVDVDWDIQLANGEQSTAISISQQMAGSDSDLFLAIATPAAQAMSKSVKDKPLLFTAVTDPLAAELVDSLEKPGANVTGTSDVAPIEEQVGLIGELVPDAKTIGVVYSSAEVNSKVQVEALTKAAKAKGIEVKSQTVTSVTEIPQALEAMGDVDTIYVPTDNTVVSGISSLIKVANDKKIPVIAADSGAVEGGAAATLGIDYTELGRQTGEMALKILRDGADPASLPVETTTEYTYVINEDAVKAQGLEIPAEILDKAEKL